VPTLKIRNVPIPVVDAGKRIARSRGVSMQRELHDFFTSYDTEEREAALEDATAAIEVANRTTENRKR
jgi:hypothetical protein